MRAPDSPPDPRPLLLVDTPHGTRAAKTPAGAFISGAKGRLLPASIPLRFFGSALVFHLAAWMALAAGAPQWPHFEGGLGWPLAALHLLTLGVLGMSVLGAGAQLLPVATRQPAPGSRMLIIVWWLYTPGVAVLALGMGVARPAWMAAGAAPVTLALLLWGMLLLRNLQRARGMPGVAAHGWTSLAALLVLLLSALALLAVWLGLPAPPRGTALALHVVFAPYGFIGVLALGLSYVLVPMFALADTPDERHQQSACTWVVLALVLAGLAALGIAPAPLRGAAVLAGSAAMVLHLGLMARVLRTGMRRLTGPGFLLVRTGWVGLLASLGLAMAMLLELPIPRLASWFGWSLIGVWQLGFVLGMLQRIAPFLAAMHGGGGRRARTPSALTHAGALRVHCVCHLTALGLLALAIGIDSTWVTLAAAVLGSAGALAYGVFFAVLLHRMRTPG